MKLLRKLLKKSPLLGICGGQQLLNVVFGGSLIQHIPDSVNTKINQEQKNPRDEGSHNVKIKKIQNYMKLQKLKKCLLIQLTIKQ